MPSAEETRPLPGPHTGGRTRGVSRLAFAREELDQGFSRVRLMAVPDRGLKTPPGSTHKAAGWSSKEMLSKGMLRRL